MCERLAKVKILVTKYGTSRFKEEFYDIKSSSKLNYQIYHYESLPESIAGIGAGHSKNEATHRIPKDNLGKKVDSSFTNAIQPDRSEIRFFVYCLPHKADIEKAKKTLLAYCKDHLEKCQIQLDSLKEQLELIE